MTADDVAVIRRAFELFNRMLDPEGPTRDREAMEAVWTDEPEIVPMRAALEGGTVYSGPDAVDRLREDSLEMWSELEIEISEITGEGPRYLVTGTLSGRGRASGAEFEAPMWFVMHVRGGRIARAASHLNRESALAELG